MKLSALLEGFQIQVVQGSLDIPVHSITDDSRAVRTGALFIARRGTTGDGHAYIDCAIAAGAAGILCELPTQTPSGRGDVTIVQAAETTRIGPLAAERLAGNPSSKLHLIGITGTNGKTTTAHLIQQLLAAAGWKCGLIGTVTTDDGAKRSPSELTTPNAYELAPLLSRMVANGCRAAVMEVSSHAPMQGQVAGLHFAAAVFTNLTGDHLDFHGTLDAYADAKSILFQMLDEGGIGVINIDDPESARMIRACRGTVITTSLSDDRANSSAIIVKAIATGVQTRMCGPWGELNIQFPLTGKYNVCNALQAITVCHALGISADALKRAIECCSAPPGRLERVSPPDCPFSVFVDYAHTDDALRNVLFALKPLVPRGSRLHVVFGCGGDRDRTKRSRMAAAAWDFADRVIITSDNPRTEDPLAIIEQVTRGVPGNRREQTIIEPDRERAIQLAIEAARGGDILIIAGKGHEDYQVIGRIKRPFDDRLVAKRALSCLAELAAT